MAVVPFFLLHLWPPAHARISRDHFLLRCVSGLLHLFIPDHPEQVKWCALITRVSRNYLHCLGFLRGYLDQERAQASPRPHSKSLLSLLQSSFALSLISMSPTHLTLPHGVSSQWPFSHSFASPTSPWPRSRALTRLATSVAPT